MGTIEWGWTRKEFHFNEPRSRGPDSTVLHSCSSELFHFNEFLTSRNTTQDFYRHDWTTGVDAEGIRFRGTVAAPPIVLGEPLSRGPDSKSVLLPGYERPLRYWYDALRQWGVNKIIARARVRPTGDLSVWRAERHTGERQRDTYRLGSVDEIVTRAASPLTDAFCILISLTNIDVALQSHGIATAPLPRGIPSSNYFLQLGIIVIIDPRCSWY